MKKINKVATSALFVAIVSGSLAAKLYNFDTTALEMYNDNGTKYNSQEWAVLPTLESEGDTFTGFKTVVDGSGTTFINIPEKMTQEQIVEHYKKKPKYANHAFFGNESYSLPNGCIPFREAVKDIFRFELADFRSTYINKCGWNGKYLDVSLKAPTQVDKAEYFLKNNAGWFVAFCLISLLGTIPALWCGFFSLVGIAIRSAKKNIEGDAGE